MKASIFVILTAIAKITKFPRHITVPLAMRIELRKQLLFNGSRHSATHNLFVGQVFHNGDNLFWRAQLYEKRACIVPGRMKRDQFFSPDTWERPGGLTERSPPSHTLMFYKTPPAFAERDEDWWTTFTLIFRSRD